MSNMTNEKKRKRLFCPQSMKSWTVSTIFYGASLAQKDDFLLKTNCVCFFVLSSLSSLSAKDSFADFYKV